MTPRFPFVRLAAVVVVLTILPALIMSPLFSAPAWSQDDDNDGDAEDDDDDGDAGDDHDSDDNSRATAVTQQPVPVSAPAPLLRAPDRASDQIVVEGLDVDPRRQLLAQGFTVLKQSRGRLLLQLPAGIDVSAALNLVAIAAPNAIVAPNSYYRSQAVPSTCDGPVCSHWDAVNWPPVTAEPFCVFEPHIGVVDTGVNADHPMLSDARLTVESIGSVGAQPSATKHGTAVVALFVGSPNDRVPGLVPDARLFVVDPFGRIGGDERSDVFALVDALDRLGEVGVDVASLSLAGPDNPLLEAAIHRLVAAGIPVVAAVGNAGPRSAALYPAAYPDVVAVTAVDSNAAIYRRAVQGKHVRFAAPGVDIPTAASISGIRPQTGTSFAVPFVTTALAAAMANGTPSSEAIEALVRTARDLGDVGRDPLFGWGLVQIPSPC